MQPPTVSVEAYGCTMNKGESRLASVILRERGWRVIDGPIPLENGVPVDALIIFTCDVIGSTERRMYRRISAAVDAGIDVYAAGCLPAVDRETMERRFPEVRIMDTMGVDDVRSSVRRHFPDIRGVGKKTEDSAPVRGAERIDTIVPIATGCIGACTYCITRFARGMHLSRPERDILDDVLAGRESERREILITSQDTGAWGSDLEGGRDLPWLLRFVTENTANDIRIRVGMSNPRHMDRLGERYIDPFGNERIFKFFHLPVQSGSDRMLDLMNRGYSASTVLSLAERIRDRFPGATLSTDIITGFPTETDEDHEMSIDIVERMRPDVLNITRFSARPGTPAGGMREQVPGWMSKERSREMTDLHSRIATARLKERMGFHEKCLICEVGKEGTMMARDINYTPIVIRGGRDLLGRFIDLETYGKGNTYLQGRIVE